jgi:hypothetical protein
MCPKNAFERRRYYYRRNWDRYAENIRRLNFLISKLLPQRPVSAFFASEPEMMTSLQFLQGLTYNCKKAMSK